LQLLNERARLLQEFRDLRGSHGKAPTLNWMLLSPEAAVCAASL